MTIPKYFLYEDFFGLTIPNKNGGHTMKLIPKSELPPDSKPPAIADVLLMGMKVEKDEFSKLLKEANPEQHEEVKQYL